MTEPTNKDQAIALAADIESDGCCAHKKEAVKLLRDLAQPPAPDCRTCGHMWIDIELGADESTSRCDSALCVNGDQYQPAHKVVLWRTK